MPRLDELQPGLELAIRGAYSKVSPQSFEVHLLLKRTANLVCASYDLPNDVFGPGEVQPTRPKRKAVTKKRVHETGDAEVMSLPSPQCWSRRWAYIADFHDTNRLCQWRCWVSLTKRPIGVGRTSKREYHETTET